MPILLANDVKAVPVKKSSCCPAGQYTCSFVAVSGKPGSQLCEGSRRSAEIGSQRYIKRISIEDAKKQFNELVFVDARSATSLARNRMQIPGVIPLPLKAIDQNLKRLPHADDCDLLLSKRREDEREYGA